MPAGGASGVTSALVVFLGPPGAAPPNRKWGPPEEAGFFRPLYVPEVPPRSATGLVNWGYGNTQLSAGWFPIMVYDTMHACHHEVMKAKLHDHGTDRTKS